MSPTDIHCRSLINWLRARHFPLIDLIPEEAVLTSRIRRFCSSRLPRSRANGDDAGQATPFVAVIIVCIAVASLAVAHLGIGAIERTQARTAADAAALAAAIDGDAAGQRLARANGATSATIVRNGEDAHATVRLGAVEAQARAEHQLVEGADGLAPAMVAAIARAEQLLGVPVPIVSGFRSPAEQQALWDNRATNPYPVAPPGTSMHERGLAIDIPAAFVPNLLSVASQVGLCQPLPATDPIHFVLCG